MKKNVMICLDRDGTIIYDKKFHLGHTSDWKKKIKILPSVIQGLKLINSQLPEAKIYITTNQPGIAIKEFPLLTKTREKEVNQYIIKQIEKRGARIDGFIFCGFAHPEYPKLHPQYTFKPELVRDAPCIKPKPGMIFEALHQEGFKKQNTNIYSIGDRAKDSISAINAGGFGILVPFINTPGEKQKLTKKVSLKHYKVCNSFLNAAKFIVKLETSF